MSICPVCNYSNSLERSNCQKCYWSLKENPRDLGLKLDDLIFNNWIKTLIYSLDDKRRRIKDLNSKNNYFLENSEIVTRLNTEIESLKERVIHLESQMTNKNNYSGSSLNIQTKNQTSEHIQSFRESERLYFSNKDIDNTRDDNNNDLGIIEIDREEKTVFNVMVKHQENIDNEINNIEYSENVDSQMNTEIDNDLNSSYQSFYRLIRNGQLEVIKVTVPQETMEKMRSGTLSDLRFSNDQKGNYWIINWHNVYCLIPKEKININQYQYGNFQRIFECQNYQENYSNFEVIEPAIVVSCDGETWQLERKGKIKFI